MAEIDVNQLKEGTAFEENGVPYRVMKFDFTKLARGKANIKVKARNLESGAIVKKGFLSGNKVEHIDLDKREMQFLYKDEDKAYFMDSESFEQTGIDLNKIGDDADYLIEGEDVWVMFWPKEEGREVLGVEIPATVEMKIVESEPGMKGDSANNVTKSAKLESGLKVQVPLFIEKGDKIKVNTESGEYVSRV